VKNTRKLLAIGVFVIVAAQPSLPWAAGQPEPNASADGAAVRQFEEAIARYMAMRRKIHGEVPGPVKNSSSTQVNDAVDALAGSIQRARQDAQVGSIFSAPVAAVIKRRIADAVRTENLAPVLADIDDDGQAAAPPKLHLRLPVSAQLATMPPSLLKVMLPLPKELEYRIVGRYLVLRDVDASLIIDYIPAAVPR
jgi:hypothetical protein